MARSINKPVGLKTPGGPYFAPPEGNMPADVMIIQNLLNHVPVDEGGLGEDAKLLPDGSCGNRTHSAIRKFQKNLVKRGIISETNGQVAPNGKTFAELAKYDVQGELKRVVISHIGGHKH